MKPPTEDGPSEGSGRPLPLTDIEGYVDRLVHHWARRLARELRLPATELADLEQELWLGLISRWPQYDAQRSSPRTFAARVVERRAASLRQRLRNASRRRAQRLAGEPGTCGPDDEDSARADRPSEGQRLAHDARGETAPEDEPGLVEDVAAVLSRLPASLREICQRLMVEDVSHVARHMGVSRASIYRRIQVARERFVAAEVHEYL